MPPMARGWVRNPYATSHNFPRSSASGWRPRPENKGRSHIPVSDKNRSLGWRSWRFARTFDFLQERLIWNRRVIGGFHCAYRVKGL